MILNWETKMDGPSTSQYQQLNQVINYNLTAQPLSICFFVIFLIHG